jgi:tRNA A37 threonylcarbamoyladenosine dehydratase
MPDASTIPPAAADLARRFGGVARLYGEEAAARLRAAHVAVVGIGGVGSWAAEALARCAVGRLTLIDMDHIAESNTNRQIHALGDAYGQSKVVAMAARIAAINPACEVHAIDDFVTVENATELIQGYDFVLDCIDEVRAKAALIAQARTRRIGVVTCGAAGGRIDAARIATGDLALISGDPLLAKVRHRLRRDFGFPRDDAKRKKFQVLAVYSDEPVQRPVAPCESAQFVGGLACAGYGSSVAVTATIGFVAASAALSHIARAAPGHA